MFHKYHAFLTCGHAVNSRQYPNISLSSLTQIRIPKHLRPNPPRGLRKQLTRPIFPRLHRVKGFPITIHIIIDQKLNCLARRIRPQLLVLHPDGRRDGHSPSKALHGRVVGSYVVGGVAWLRCVVCGAAAEGDVVVWAVAETVGCAHGERPAEVGGDGDCASWGDDGGAELVGKEMA